MSTTKSDNPIVFFDISIGNVVCIFYLVFAHSLKYSKVLYNSDRPILAKMYVN